MAECYQPILDTVSTGLIEKGWSLVEADVDPSDLVAVRSLLNAVGNGLTQDDTVPAEVSIIAPSEKPRALAGTNQAMSFHTDNVYLDTPCRTVALFCGVQAAEGGINELLDGIQVLRELPDEIQEQFMVKQWSWTNPATQRVAGPYAVYDEAADRVRWWRTGLRDATLGALAAAETFEAALTTSEQHETVLMKPGDMLVTDNGRILHNRSAFTGDRRVYRARYW